MPQSRSARRHELEAVIDRLARELEGRRADPRPPPLAVVRAYRVLMQRHYQALDCLGDS